VPERAGRYRIVLAKEDFKFSAAHFTIFGAGRAELFHGHNYQVTVELAGEGLDDTGLLADIQRVKQAIRVACARLDSRTLIPAASREIAWAEEGDAVEVRFDRRLYRFPAADVLLLPLANTSMELLARMLWEEIAPQLAGSRVEALAVSVEESAGQRCAYEAPLAGPAAAPPG
jgi:6-pyruvoyltetrahydropterin/6-carboxytetrahydropterin synthase